MVFGAARVNLFSLNRTGLSGWYLQSGAHDLVIMVHTLNELNTLNKCALASYIKIARLYVQVVTTLMVLLIIRKLMPNYYIMGLS